MAEVQCHVCRWAAVKLSSTMAPSTGVSTGQPRRRGLGGSQELLRGLGLSESRLLGACLPLMLRVQSTRGPGQQGVCTVRRASGGCPCGLSVGCADPSEWPACWDGTSHGLFPARLGGGVGPPAAHVPGVTDLCSSGPWGLLGMEHPPSHQPHFSFLGEARPAGVGGREMPEISERGRPPPRACTGGSEGSSAGRPQGPSPPSLIPQSPADPGALWKDAGPLGAQPGMEVLVVGGWVCSEGHGGAGSLCRTPLVFVRGWQRGAWARGRVPAADRATGLSSRPPREGPWAPACWAALWVKLWGSHVASSLGTVCLARSLRYLARGVAAHQALCPPPQPGRLGEHGTHVREDSAAGRGQGVPGAHGPRPGGPSAARGPAGAGAGGQGGHAGRAVGHAGEWHAPHAGPFPARAGLSGSLAHREQKTPRAS